MNTQDSLFPALGLNVVRATGSVAKWKFNKSETATEPLQARASCEVCAPSILTSTTFGISGFPPLERAKSRIWEFVDTLSSKTIVRRFESGALLSLRAESRDCSSSYRRMASESLMSTPESRLFKLRRALLKASTAKLSDPKELKVLRDPLLPVVREDEAMLVKWRF